MVEDVVVGSEDAIGEPVVAQELPDVFGRVELGRLGRERQQGDVGGDGEPVGHVPSGLIEHEQGVGTRLDGHGDLVEMELHGRGVALGEHEPGALALGGADGAEDVGRLGALVVRRAGPGAAARPAPGDLVLLADARLVLPPDLYRGAGRQARPERRQLFGEVFLKAASANSFWAW